MSSYQPFTSTRVTDPDPASLFASLRAIDATAGMQHQPGSSDYVVKTATPLTPAQTATAQVAIDTAPVRDDAALDCDQKVLKALVIGLHECIPNPTMTKAQLRARIIAIWKTL